MITSYNRIKKRIKDSNNSSKIGNETSTARVWKRMIPKSSLVEWNMTEQTLIDFNELFLVILKANNYRLNKIIELRNVACVPLSNIFELMIFNK